VAHVISMTGTVLAHLALTVLVYTRTGSPLLSALVLAVAFAPRVIAGTLLTGLVDRVDSRRLLVNCNLLSGVVALGMAVPGTPVAALLLLAFILGLIQPVFAGARAATLPDVLAGPAYIPGRSLIRLVAQAAQLGGFALSGVLLTVVSPRFLLLANAASFLASALVLRWGTRRRVPSGRVGARVPLLRDSVAGIGEVFSVPPLRRVLLFSWTVTGLAVTPEALAVPYAMDRSAGTVGAGLLLTAMPLGTITGELLANWLVPAARQARIVVPAALVVFLPALCFVLQPGIVPAFALLFAAGLGAAHHVGLDRQLLATTPEDLRPRALAIQTTGLMFWQGVAFAAAGATAEMLPPAVVIPAAAICGMCSVAWYHHRSRGRRLASTARWAGGR
jgi:Na+/melibiose symporter-like transporter